MPTVTGEIGGGDHEAHGEWVIQDNYDLSAIFNSSLPPWKSSSATLIYNDLDDLSGSVYIDGEAPPSYVGPDDFSLSYTMGSGNKSRITGVLDNPIKDRFNAGGRAGWYIPNE
jgi:hypothetical protein